MNIAKYLRTTFYVEHLRWLLLQVSYKKKSSENFANLERIVIAVLFFKVTGLELAIL